MKKIKFLALTMSALLSANFAWGETEKYTFSSFESADDVTFEATNYTIDMYKNTAGTAPTWNDNSSEARLYAAGSLVISSTKTITKIEYYYVVNANKKGVEPTIDGVSGGTGSEGTWNSETKIWTGSSNEVTFSTSGTAGNLGFQWVNVTYTAGSTKADVTLTPTQNARNLTVDDIVEDLSTWYTVSPAAYDGTITYTSSNEDIFAEDEGAGYGFSAGTCNLYINAPETSNYKAANCTISVTVTAPTCYVTFLNNSQPISGTGIDAQGRKQYHKGDQLGELPTLDEDDACDKTSNHFMGWTSDAGFQKRDYAPSFVTSSTTVTGDMTLRAVWAKEQ